MTRLRAFISLSLLSMLALVVVGTGGSATAAKPGIPPLPAAMQGKKSIDVAVQVGIPPIGFADANGKPVGVGADEVRALAKVTGYPFRPVVAVWEAALPGLASGRFQAVQGASITDERKKIYDMVHDFSDAYKFLVKAGAPAIPNTLSGLCGLKLADTAGDVMIPYLESVSKKQCVAKGKEPFEIVTYPRLADALIAAKAGRVDVVTQAVTALGWIQKQQPSQWKLTGPLYATQKISFATAKGSGLAKVMAAGLNAMIKNGMYAKILKKYGVSDGAIPRSTVNPPVAPKPK